jgi:hypothetical protein
MQQKNTFIDDSRYLNKSGKFGDTFGGSLISSSAPKIFELGLGLVNQGQQKKLQDRAYNQSVELEKLKYQQSLELAKQQEKALAIQNQIAQKNLLASQKPTQKKNKWVLPVAIGGGVIVLGIIIYFVTKKK